MLLSRLQRVIMVIPTCLLFLFAAACQPSAPKYPPIFTPQDCLMPISNGYEVRCGTVAVPEDRERSSGKEVILAIAVVSASGSAPTLPPAIFLDGGPGGPTLISLSERIQLFKNVIAERPVVFFDQRGVGMSQPALDCPELSQAQQENIQQVLPKMEENHKSAQALSACKQRLEGSGASLAAYTTAASADDVRDIVNALGYPQVYLMGVSYGTRLAQVIILRHQADGWIAGAILDSVVPLQMEEVQEFWPNTQANFKQLFARCAAEQACSTRYPDLQSTFYATVEQLEANPEDVSIFHPLTGKSMTVKLDGHDFVSVLFLLQYDPYQAAKIPQIIDKVNQGDTEILKEPLEFGVAALEVVYEGMSQSVNCTDEGMKLDLPAIHTAHAALDPVFQKLADGNAEQTEANCRAWGVKAARPAENRALQTDLPVLILSGSEDPITPAAWGELLHASLSNSYFYQFNGLSHGTIGALGSAGTCVEKLVLAFLQDPTQEADASCVQLQKPIRFAVPAK